MATPAHSRVADRLLVRRLQQRLGALVVASALIGTSVPAIALAVPTQEEIGRMYGEGQAYMEQKEYKRAADVFSRLLNLIEESADNKAIRESLILNILDAHMQAYEGIVDANGKQDIEQLKQGKETLQRYYKDFQAVHGDSVAVIAEIQTTATRLDQLLKDAEPHPEDPDVTKQDKPEETEEKNDQPTETVVIRQGSSADGLGLIIGGVGLGVLGLGAAAMIPIGSIGGQNAEKDLEAAQEAEQTATSDAFIAQAISDQKDANEAGDRSNAVLITGAVLTPLLLGGAAALIIVGVKRRRDASSQAALRPAETLTAAPSFGRNYSGFSLSGRF